MASLSQGRKSPWQWFKLLSLLDASVVSSFFFFLLSILNLVIQYSNLRGAALFPLYRNETEEIATSA